MPFSMMMNKVCHAMLQGEIFNADREEYPLFDAVLYSDRVSTSKFSKRLCCSVKHLPLRIPNIFLMINSFIVLYAYIYIKG